MPALEIERRIQIVVIKQKARRIQVNGKIDTH